MTYTFYSPIAQESAAYNLGYKDGFNQMPANAGRMAPWYIEKYHQGYKDGYKDYVATPTRTGIK